MLPSKAPPGAPKRDHSDLAGPAGPAGSGGGGGGAGNGGAGKGAGAPWTKHVSKKTGRCYWFNSECVRRAARPRRAPAIFFGVPRVARDPPPHGRRTPEGGN